MVVGLGVHFSQGFKRFVASGQNEVLSHQVGLDMLHDPDGGGHIEEVWRVVTETAIVQ